MTEFHCATCGTPFTLSQEVLDRFPGWRPRFCRDHRQKKTPSSSSRGPHATTTTARGPQRGGAQRRGTVREENLKLSEILTRYSGGPQEGVFTDGSASPNPGKGGWGFAQLVGGELINYRYGHSPDTTNNRMEMTAIIEALSLLPLDSELTIYTDSQLCANTLNQWAHSWARKGWTRKSGPIKNLDLVQEAYTLKQARPKVKIEWLAAHSGHLGNELADSLATAWMRDEL